MYLLIVIWQQLLRFLRLEEQCLELGDWWREQAMLVQQVADARLDTRTEFGWMRIHPLLVGAAYVPLRSYGVVMRGMPPRRARRETYRSRP